MKINYSVLAIVFAFCTITYAQSSKNENNNEERKADIVGAQAKKGNPAKQTVYFVQTSHNPEQCISVMDELKNNKEGVGVLENSYFGCKKGNHIICSFVDAADEAEARLMLPASMQKSAKIIPVERWTPALVERMHKK